MPVPSPLSIAETRARLRADHERLLAILRASRPDDPPRSARFHPAYVCVALYRLSNHLFRAGHRRSARLLWHLNLVLTGADISEPADLGPGLVVMHPPGTAIMGTAGRNLTVMACAGIGGELGRREDVGAGPGLAVLGDDVVLEPHSGVLGPVRIGHRVRVGAGIAIARDVPDDTCVEWPQPRYLPRKDRP